MKQLLDLSKTYVRIVYVVTWTNETHTFRREECVIYEKKTYLCTNVTIFLFSFFDYLLIMKERLLVQLLLVGLTAWPGNAHSAQSDNLPSENLRIHFDFSNVSGTNVTDDVSGVTASLKGAAKVIEVGQYHILDLGNATGYLDMTRNAGAIVKELQDFTVSVCYRVNASASLSGQGYFLWCFSQSSANTANASPYTAYRLNAQRMATSTGGYNHEVGMETGTPSSKGKWIHMLYRQKGQCGELFIDGHRVQTNTQMPVLSATFTTVPAYNWIGRPPFSGDNYLKQTQVADFRIYDACVSDDAARQLAAEAQSLEEEYKYGTPGDFTSLEAKVGDCLAFIASAGDNYAPNAVAELKDEVHICQMELQARRASQTLIDEHVKTLSSLLAKAKSTINYTAKQVFGATADHGFVHPGGVVSQQDIDRARQLLASGDTRIKRAWEILCANEYSSSGIATWPTETVVRGGSGGQNYMNCARGAAMAFQNALRWKIGGTRVNADAAVRIMMQWARECKGLGGDTNVSLAAGIYGHEWANAAELMRDYDGWSREDFETFRQWMVRVFYNPAIDFLRRRHDTWLNARYSNLGQRPGHYWSNWGLCNALCVMSIGILCDDVHMYNQGVSFYKYDHVGTYKDHSSQSVILNDGCNEFIGNLVPVVLPDERGPFGYLGQMQESGRDQGHSLMALGLAVDLCQVGLNQGDDLFAYMDDRIAAGAEFVAASNFGGVDTGSLPWKNYNYADCRGTMGAGWLMTGVNTGGAGEYRPYWDRLIGYYEGLRGVKMQYSEAASAKICPDGGGGNYSQNSGGFDHLGFSTLTSWRPAACAEEGITPLSGNIIYKGVTYVNQTNLGGLKYNYSVCPSKGIPADGSEITLQPQLPEGVTDTGQWLWNTGETTREITVRADHSYIYRVSYTAANGTVSQQAFAIAVCGDAPADVMTNEITVEGVIERSTEKTVLEGTSVILYAGAATGWTDDYLWDNGQKNSAITIPTITSSRTYTCQYANQSGAVSESVFHLNVVPAMQTINDTEGSEIEVLSGSSVTLRLVIPSYMDSDGIVWSDGTKGNTLILDHVQDETEVTATYQGDSYSYIIHVKASDYTYYNLLTTDKGYQLVTSADYLVQLSDDHYFVLASDDADLLIGLANAPLNGNKALFYQTPADPLSDLSKVFTFEPFDGGFCLRNIDYDGLLLQTEMNAPHNLRTHDQPYPISWARLLMSYADATWTVENGTYPGNWLGLWTPAHGYKDGEEMALNKKGDDIGHLQIFAISKALFHQQCLVNASEEAPVSATPFVVNPQFTGNGFGWNMNGTWGNQRFNGAVEVWHSSDFDFSQTINGLPSGRYSVACQMANGEGNNTGFLYASSGTETERAVVTQSCKGSNFDAERNKMSANASYGRLSLMVEVTDGALTIGIKEPATGTTWLVWDNVTLTYHGNMLSGIEDLQEEALDFRRTSYRPNAIYDLQGRRLSGVPTKGIYLRNGKKHIAR